MLGTRETWPRICGSCPFTICLSLFALLFFATGMGESLEFDAVQVTQGQWWRVLTGHLTHFSASHLLWDLTVFAVLGALCESRDREATYWTIFLSALLIPLAIVMHLKMNVYRGLSGIDTALFALFAGTSLWDSIRAREWMLTSIFGGFLAGMVGKIVWETGTGDCLFVDPTESGFIPVPLAHFCGAVIGIGVGMIRQAKWFPTESGSLPVTR